MILELLLKTAIGMGVLYLLAIAYVSILLGIARSLSSAARALAAFITYLVFAAVLVAPLLYLLDQYQVKIGQSWGVLAAVMASYLLIAMPAVFYVLRRKPELQQAGFFERR